MIILKLELGSLDLGARWYRRPPQAVSPCPGKKRCGRAAMMVSATVALFNLSFVVSFWFLIWWQLSTGKVLRKASLTTRLAHSGEAVSLDRLAKAPHFASARGDETRLGTHVSHAVWVSAPIWNFCTSGIDEASISPKLAKCHIVSGMYSINCSSSSCTATESHSMRSPASKSSGAQSGSPRCSVLPLCERSTDTGTQQHNASRTVSTWSEHIIGVWISDGVYIYIYMWWSYALAFFAFFDYFVCLWFCSCLLFVHAFVDVFAFRSRRFANESLIHVQWSIN